MCTESKINCRQGSSEASARWARKAKNRDVSTGPLACPFARSLAPLTRLLAPHCSLRSRAPLRSLVRSLAHSLAPELVGQWNIFVQFSRCPESLCTLSFLALNKKNVDRIRLGDVQLPPGQHIYSTFMFQRAFSFSFSCLRARALEQAHACAPSHAQRRLHVRERDRCCCVCT